ncbi:MAG: DNA polymerase I [Clostridiales bacterium]|jgi:DNA polymerase-1|nr:DNA polymerase I [Clostridiales bacterium]
MIIDGNNLINRAFYAMPTLNAPSGEPTNAVYGFLNMLFKLLEDENADFFGVAFDLRAPTFRHKMFEQYKATRSPMMPDLARQIPMTKNLLKLMNIPIYQLEGYEADDLIGTLAAKAESEGFDVVVVSGDKDLLQCATEKVKIRVPKTKGSKTVNEIYYAVDVLDSIGVTPEQFVHVKALMGDSSDNIPGVPGIGEKTAVKIISQYKTIENAINHVDEIKPKKASQNLKQFEEQARLSYDLAKINTDSPVDIIREKAEIYTKEAYAEIERLGFKTLSSQFKKFSITDSKQITEITQEMITECCGAFTCSVTEKGAVVFDGKVTEEKEDSFFSSDIKKITIDLKNDIKKLNERDIALNNVVFDTTLGFYVANAGKTPSETLNLETAFAMYSQLKNTIQEQEQNFIYYDVELPLAYVLADMEMYGIKVDTAEIEKYAHSLDKKISELSEKIYQMAGETFNINSPKQVGEVIYDKMKLGTNIGKKKAKTLSTNADALLKLEHPIAKTILDYRLHAKLKSTYADGVLATAKKDGRVHSTFIQTAAATGRISSIEPNLQNIPIKTELGRNFRKVFIPEDGFVFLDADYSQIELRILACLSGDKTLITAFNDNIDIHTLTASQVFRVPFSEVTSDQRRYAKAVNFGIVYGISAFSLAEDIGTTVKEADKYISGYFEKYPDVKIYLDETVKNAREKGYTETIFGRRRYIPELLAGNFNTRSAGERIAMNSPIQGSAADIIKVAMVRIYSSIKRENLRSRLLLQVHDELLLEVFEPEKEIIMQIVKSEMENAVKLPVKLDVDVHFGKTWFDAK